MSLVQNTSDRLMKKAVTGIFFKRPSRRADTVVTGFYIACHCSAFVFARAFFPRPAHARASSPAGLSARLLSWAGRLGHSQKNNTVQRKQKIHGSLDRAAAPPTRRRPPASLTPPQTLQRYPRSHYFIARRCTNSSATAAGRTPTAAQSSGAVSCDSITRCAGTEADSICIPRRWPQLHP
jgi:hypothetical protein